MLDHDLLIFLLHLGSFDWDFAGMWSVQNVIARYGSDADKIRLAALNVGYQYTPVSSELTLSVSDVKFLDSMGITTGDFSQQVPRTDGVLKLMDEYDIPVTRESYLRMAFFGNPPDELDGEIEADLPEEFQ